MQCSGWCFIFCLLIFSLLMANTLSASDSVPGIESRYKDFIKRQNVEVPEFKVDPVWLEFSGSVNLLPFHQMLIENPFQAMDYIQVFCERIAERPDDLRSLIVNASILINQRAGILSSRSIKEEITWEDFSSALRLIDQEDRSEIDDERLEQWQQSYERLDHALIVILYDFLHSLHRSSLYVQAGRESFRHVAPLSKIHQMWNASHQLPLDIQQVERLLHSGDFHAIFTAGGEICAWINRHFYGERKYNFSELEEEIILSTSLGEIIIRGQQTDHHAEEKPPLLLLDLGGNDTYIDHYSQANIEHPFSITIDLNGDDCYRTEIEGEGAGSAVFGVSALIDLGAGDDSFQGREKSFGYALGGVAVIVDASGSTSWQAESKSLSASDMGISILVDTGGDDTYSTIHTSQASAGPGGCSILLDAQGNDHYISSATPVLFPSAQLPQQNFSASQGFGSGRFGAVLDGHSFTGGVGILVDRAGDDCYEASVFAQGAGYGFGVGALADLAGNDSYRCSWYGMGSAAHSACGFLYDAAGDDRYHASHYMIGGAANDLALAVFTDSAGNDSYIAQNASFGYGLLNSFALCIDSAGDDSYRLENGLGLGAARNERQQTLRGLMQTYGLFYDGDGEDAYFPHRFNNSSSWANPDLNQFLFGIGCDIVNEATPAKRME
jgi:hypothetical protein